MKQPLLDQLGSYVPATKVESTHLIRTIELVKESEYDNITVQEKQGHHLTASGVIVSKLGVLLHLHKRIPMWFQPGGHIDLGETPLESVRREVLEETGLTPIFRPEIFDVDVHDTTWGHVHYDIRYLAWCEDTNFNPPVGESQKVAWFSLPAAEQVVDGGLLRILNKIKDIKI